MESSTSSPPPFVASRSLTWPYEADDGATWRIATGGSWYVEIPQLRSPSIGAFVTEFSNGNCEIDWGVGIFLVILLARCKPWKQHCQFPMWFVKLPGVLSDEHLGAEDQFPYQIRSKWATCWALSIGLENYVSFPRPKVEYVIIPCRSYCFFLIL